MSSSLDFELGAQLAARVGKLEAGQEYEREWRRRCAGAIQKVSMAGKITITGGAGSTIHDRDKNQAKTGYFWSIRRMTAFNFSAGEVIAYKNDVLGEPLAPYPVPSVFTFGRGEMMLMPGDTVIWSASGVTAAAGYVQYWIDADCFEQWYLPYYIG